MSSHRDTCPATPMSDRFPSALEQRRTRFEKPFTIGGRQEGYKHFETLQDADDEAHAMIHMSGSGTVYIYQLVAVVEVTTETLTAEDPGVPQ